MQTELTNEELEFAGYRDQPSPIFLMALQGALTGILQRSPTPAPHNAAHEALLVAHAVEREHNLGPLKFVDRAALRKNGERQL